MEKNIEILHGAAFLANEIVWTGESIKATDDIIKAVDNVLYTIANKGIINNKFSISDIVKIHKSSSIENTRLTWFMLQRGFVTSSKFWNVNSLVSKYWNNTYGGLLETRETGVHIHSREVTLTDLGKLAVCAGKVSNLKIAITVNNLNKKWYGRIIIRLFSHKLFRDIKIQDRYTIMKNDIEQNIDLINL